MKMKKSTSQISCYSNFTISPLFELFYCFKEYFSPVNLRSQGKKCRIEKTQILLPKWPNVVFAQFPILVYAAFFFLRQKHEIFVLVLGNQIKSTKSCEFVSIFDQFYLIPLTNDDEVLAAGSFFEKIQKFNSFSKNSNFSI